MRGWKKQDFSRKQGDLPTGVPCPVPEGIRAGGYGFFAVFLVS